MEVVQHVIVVIVFIKENAKIALKIAKVVS